MAFDIKDNRLRRKEAVGMDLEDIFLQLVDHPETSLESMTSARAKRRK